MSVSRPQLVSSTPLSVVAYYTVWSYCDMPPQDVDYSAITHLVLFGGASSGITPNVNTAPYFPPATPGNNSFSITFTGTPGWCANPIAGKNHVQVMRDSCNAHGVKLLLDLGGEYGTPASAFAALIADTTKFDTYINAVDSITRHNVYGVQFDGVSIDWEFPTEGATGRANYTLFLTKLRAKLDTWTPNKGLIGMAVPTWYWWDTKHTDPVIDLSTLNTKVDLINLMEYGMENTSAISHYSPLYKNSAVSQETWDLRGINEWKGAGVDPSRIVTLLPFESIKMTDNSGITPVAIGHAGGSASWIGIRDIPAGVTVHYDSISMCNWAESGNSFYSYENATSLAAKVQYVRSKSIGGLGIWELWRGWLPNAAAGQHDPLLQALKAAVGGIITPPDTIKPVVTLTSPANGDTVTGIITVTANATDNNSVASVQLLVNGVVTATDNTSPYSFAWNTTNLSGSQILAVKATDPTGNSATTSPITVFVIKAPPDTIKPVVTLTSPVNGDTVSGAVIVKATASDNNSVASVQLLVNGVAVAIDNTSPYTFTWNATTLSGAQILAVKATDAAGNSTTTSPITVFVKPLPVTPAQPWIYQDILEAPWRDTSWNSANIYNSTDQVYAGLYSLKVTQVAWGAFSVHTGSNGSGIGISPFQYSLFQLAVYNTTPSLILNIYCNDDNGDVFPNNLQFDVPVGQWTTISLPMDQLDPNNYPITRVNIQNYTRLNPTYYLDNIRFVDTTLKPPPAPVLISPIGGAFINATTVNFSWNSVPTATEYFLEVGRDSTFATILFGDSTLTSTSQQIGTLTTYPAYYWRVRASNANGSSGWSTVRQFQFVNITHWVLVSLPLNARDPRTSAVFPTALSNAFAYRSGQYIISDTLTPGLGYWMQFGSDQTMAATGTPILKDTINVSTGWNLIGSISAAISTNSIVSVPPGIDVSDIFEYGTSYSISDSIRPGQGYWLKSSQPAKLIFSSGSSLTLAGVVRLSYDLEQPPPPPGNQAPIEKPKEIPKSYSLLQNYPNPFNPTTTVSFAIPNNDFVTLKVYDILGREVEVLVNEWREAGTYSAHFEANRLASGIYIYRLTAGSFTQVKKMVLLK